ncbi:hypothetical protein CMV_023443 [Castanea mollissima]|uniref:Uncharacterized protein n=1 Tax=Castanea mollissima TaxID=60419 RepID=A0A8J4QG02_9ROSI|nr:hypothetical protein CMV_023443 [Castanea mollissima]
MSKSISFLIIFTFYFLKGKTSLFDKHPILLTSQERLDFVVSSLRLLKYERKSSDWKNKYDAQYRDEEDKKARRLKEPEYKVVNVNKSDPNSEVNYIATKVEKYEEYKKVYNYDHKKGSYPNTASSQITFSRNVIIHINDDGQYKTGEEVGKQLKIFFPDLWMRLFSLMISEGIDVWDQSNEKYGGDLLSQWRATLKLCILDNDDFATQPFLKICRSFLSFLDMKADKSVAISSLVTTIKKQIITVESKFLQDQFKYRKLEEMLKDDNVSGTSTKCIKFLMRKEEILKKHRNLLESVHSNEEFKSLLGNPKNIKDCGISVAESLTIWTDRWDKLSNEMNANKKQGARGGIVAATSVVAVTETTARAREAGVVAASSGDSMVAATGVGDSMVAASSGDSMVATTSSGDSTVSDGTNSQHVVVPTVEKAIQRVQSRKKKKNKGIKGKT